MAHITCDGRVTKIEGLVSDDPSLGQLLAAHPSSDWPEVVERALAVGAKGLLTMGVDLGLEGVRSEVRRQVEEANSAAEKRVAEMLSEAERTITEQLDPDRRTSLLSKSLREFHKWQETLFAGFDVDQAGSVSSRLVDRLETLVGPKGLLEERLQAALDPEADDSALARMRTEMLSEIQALRDALYEEKGKRSEAELGTRKGFLFEDAVEDVVRAWAGGIGSCVVERTSRAAGALGPEALVGDLTVALTQSSRVVIEAKNTGRIGLAGSDGILEELDRAMANRQAQVAICVSARDAFPTEVGHFAIYGNRVLVVDAGDGAALAVALRVAQLLLVTSTSAGGDGVDHAALLDHLDRIGTLSKRFSTAKRALTEAQAGIGSAKDLLEAMRSELIELVGNARKNVRLGSPSD